MWRFSLTGQSGFSIHPQIDEEIRWGPQTAVVSGSDLLWFIGPITSGSIMPDFSASISFRLGHIHTPSIDRSHFVPYNQHVENQKTNFEDLFRQAHRRLGLDSARTPGTWLLQFYREDLALRAAKADLVDPDGFDTWRREAIRRGFINCLREERFMQLHPGAFPADEWEARGRLYKQDYPIWRQDLNKIVRQLDNKE